METVTQNNAQKIYPTTPDVDGFYFVDAEDEARDVLTLKNDKGEEFKKVILKNGDIAIIRELKGVDVIDARRIAGNNTDQSEVMAAMASLATKVNDKQIIYEDFINYKASDFTKILSASTSLNFL